MSNAATFIASLSAALGIAGALLRSGVRAVKTLTLLVELVHDTAERVTKLENGLKVNAQQRKREADEIKDKLPEG